MATPPAAANPTVGATSNSASGASPRAGAAPRSAIEQGALPGEGPLRVDLSRVPSDTPFKVKLLRGVWGLFQLPFFPHTPQALSPLRIALLRFFGAKIGDGCLIGAGVKVWVPWNLIMGDYSTLGADTEVQNFAPVTLGRHVVVSQRNYICTSTHDHTDPFFSLISTPIVIGSQSWVASECVLGPGSGVGEGAVVSVRSVVSSIMPPWMVCAGTPCRPLTERLVSPLAEEPAGSP